MKIQLKLRKYIIKIYPKTKINQFFVLIMRKMTYFSDIRTHEKIINFIKITLDEQTSAKARPSKAPKMINGSDKTFSSGFLYFDVDFKIHKWGHFELTSQALGLPDYDDGMGRAELLSN